MEVIYVILYICVSTTRSGAIRSWQPTCHKWWQRCGNGAVLKFGAGKAVRWRRARCLEGGIGNLPRLVFFLYTNMASIECMHAYICLSAVVLKR